MPRRVLLNYVFDVVRLKRFAEPLARQKIYELALGAATGNAGEMPQRQQQQQKHQKQCENKHILDSDTRFVDTDRCRSVQVLSFQSHSFAVDDAGDMSTRSDFPGTFIQSNWAESRTTGWDGSSFKFKQTQTQTNAHTRYSEIHIDVKWG